MAAEKRCERCGDPFLASHPKTKWCVACQWRSCETCATAFRVKPKKPNQRFCSADCRTYEITRTCEVCGQDYSGWTKSKWCPDCRHRECKHCGAAFELSLNRAKENLFCSHDCWVADHRQRRAEKFWAKVDKTGECWIWKGAKNNRSYGLFYAEKKAGELAHRVSYEIANGSIPNGLILLHVCDCPACVRPEHLLTGTRHENIMDMMAKGRNRHPFGEDHFRSKLNRSQAEEAKRIVAGNGGRFPYGKLTELAKRWGVHRNTIQSAVNGRTWNLDDESGPLVDKVQSLRKLPGLQQMYEAQRGLCAYCEVPLNGEYHIDHMTPTSRGGANDLSNLALACPSCNVRKGTQTVEEFVG